jgi:surface antigen
LRTSWPTMLWRKFRTLFVRIGASRRVVRFSLLALNVLLLISIGVFALRSTQADQVLNKSLARSTGAGGAEPLDQLSSADIAVSAALATGLPETTAVTNQADSVAAELTVAPADTTVIAKPQTVATAFKSRRDIKTYTVLPGETVASIAAKFNITSNSIMWSNNLSGNIVNAGLSLLIPPVNGIVYTVRGGDTIDTLAQKYRANREQLIAINDIELTGLKVGERILLPNAQQPAPVVLARAVAIYGPYNGYDYGFCTWYVANRRAQAGNPVPGNLGNASTWDSRAAAMGLAVGKGPSVGAAVVTSYRGAGHVAFVEAINADGSIWISEMNSYGQVSMTDSRPRGGWGVVDWKLIAAGTAAGYNYIR